MSDHPNSHKDRALGLEATESTLGAARAVCQALEREDRFEAAERLTTGIAVFGDGANGRLGKKVATDRLVAQKDHNLRQPRRDEINGCLETQ